MTTPTLKEAYQIATVPAYLTRDGQRFHTAAEAQAHTRARMVDAVINSAIKANPEFAKLDRPLLAEFCLLAGAQMGAVMAEPLTPAVPAPKAVPPAAVNIAPIHVAIGDEVNPDDAKRIKDAEAEAARSLDRALKGMSDVLARDVVEDERRIAAARRSAT